MYVYYNYYCVWISSHTAGGHITVSRKQIVKIQEICDHAGIADSTIPHLEAEGILNNGYLPGIEISTENGNGEDGDWLGEGMPAFNHSGISYDDSKLNFCVIDWPHISPYCVLTIFLISRSWCNGRPPHSD